jgi:predicted DNA-binding mobile mystery protein A
MRDEFSNLPVKPLDPSLEVFRAAQSLRPRERGWIRAIREAAGVSAAELGRILGVSRQLPLQFEKAEADGSITLKSLRNVANALDCDLVYALVPRAGSMRGPTGSRVGAHARKSDGKVDRSKALERQGLGRIEGAVEAEAADFENDTRGSFYCD